MVKAGGRGLIAQVALATVAVAVFLSAGSEVDGGGAIPGAGRMPLLYVDRAYIAVDGSMDDWPATLPLILDSPCQFAEGRPPAGGSPGSPLPSATVRALFDPANLYLYAEIADDSPMRNAHADGRLASGDCLEAWIELEDGPGKGVRAGLLIGLAEGARTWLVAAEGRPLSGHRVATRRTGRGIALEARVPLANIAGALEPAPGMALSLEIILDQSSDGAVREHRIAWAGDGSVDASDWGPCALVGDEATMRRPTFLAPRRLLADPDFPREERLHVYYDGLPWQGAVLVDGVETRSDPDGMVPFLLRGAGLRAAATVADRPIAASFGEGESLVHEPKAIRINQNGYDPSSPKTFTLAGPAAGAETFTVRPAVGGDPVFEGPLGKAARDPVTGEVCRRGDFSALEREGTYVVVVVGSEGDMSSHPFPIAPGRLAALFRTAARSYFLQRCGVAVDDPESGLRHAACHVDDGLLRGGARPVPAAGGWHDAGDYGKYIPPAAVTVVRLLSLAERAPGAIAALSFGPAPGGAGSDYLGEVRWELDWMLSMQDADGGVFHKVSTPTFPGGIAPESDAGPRLVYPKGSSDSALFAGAMAYAARVFGPLDPAYAGRLRAAAIKAWAFLESLGDAVLWPENDATGAYRTTNHEHEVFWAAAELFRLTGEARFGERAKGLSKRVAAWTPLSWDDVSSLGIDALVANPTAPGWVRKRLLGLVKAGAEALLARAEASGYGSVLVEGDFRWASNKAALEAGVNLLRAYELFRDGRYRAAARAQLDYVLGLNALCKSFVTGIGADPVRAPHHRYLPALGVVVPGLLVGGPNAQAQDGSYPAGLGPRSYRDGYESYACNESAIDYNAPLVFLAGYFAP